MLSAGQGSPGQPPTGGTAAAGAPELWAGPECTVNRVADRFADQIARNGFDRRLDDIDRLSSLGVRAVRLPLLWERHVARLGDKPDWGWARARVGRLRELGIRVIGGLMHHGSGPRGTDLLDPALPAHLARFAASAAHHLPGVQDWTPVNEPLTTARFSALYGLWYPHRSDARSFLRALLHQVQATAAAMAAIRAIHPQARLVQTEDLGLTRTASPLLQPQADHENHRRWLSLDLLCGRVVPGHPLWDWLLAHGMPEPALRVLAAHPCPPDIVGINSYVTSERFLDDRLSFYPSHLHGGNGVQRYVDVETARVMGAQVGGFEARLREAWDRYRLPLAITEVHLGCTRDEQMRWLHQAWKAAQALRTEAVDVRAVTVWAAFGTYDWDSLVTREQRHYEPGLWDVRSEPPRPTALASLAAQLARGETPDHPVLNGPGWWQRDLRLAWPCHGSLEVLPVRGRPLLIAGATGTLGQAFARLCEVRGLPYHLLSRAEMDIASPGVVEAVLAHWRPWAVVNAAGFVRLDEAEHDPRHWRENAEGPAVLARACARAGVRLLAFSSDQVFDGQALRPYVESDAPQPLNAYGRGKLSAERQVLEADGQALVIRTAAFFGPWDRHNFVTLSLEALRRGEPVLAAEDQMVSPTYVPDLVNASLDLLVDGETGLWHLAHPDAVSWADLARLAAWTAGLDPAQVQALPAAALGQLAARPRYAVLGSERGQLMTPLQSALERYLRDLDLARPPPARRFPLADQAPDEVSELVAGPVPTPMGGTRSMPLPPAAA